MNKLQVTGRLEEVKGEVKEVVGKVIGNTELAAEDKLGQVTSKAEAKAGDLANKAEKTIDKVLD